MGAEKRAPPVPFLTTTYPSPPKPTSRLHAAQRHPSHFQAVPSVQVGTFSSLSPRRTSKILSRPPAPFASLNNFTPLPLPELQLHLSQAQLPERLCLLRQFQLEPFFRFKGRRLWRCVYKRSCGVSTSFLCNQPRPPCLAFCYRRTLLPCLLCAFRAHPSCLFEI